VDGAWWLGALGDCDCGGAGGNGSSSGKILESICLVYCSYLVVLWKWQTKNNRRQPFSLQIKLMWIKINLMT